MVVEETARWSSRPNRTEPILCAVLYIATPDEAARDGRPKIAKKRLRMVPRVDDAVILPGAIHRASNLRWRKLIVHKSDSPLRIGDRDDGVLVKRGLKICRPLVQICSASPDSKKWGRLSFASFMDAAPGRLALSDRDL